LRSALNCHKPYVTPEVAEIVFQRFVTGAAPTTDEAGGELSEREREIVQLLVEGYRNKEIAAKLGVGAKTVEGHRAAIMRKLKLKAFSEPVRWAIRNNVIGA
jgi:DNA-binding NarL/FixJ family response regulator